MVGRRGLLVGIVAAIVLWGASAEAAQAELSVRWSAIVGDGASFEVATEIVRDPESGDIWVVSTDYGSSGHLTHLASDGRLISTSEMPSGYVLMDLMIAADGSLYALGFGQIDDSSSFGFDPFVARLSDTGQIEWLQSLSRWIMFPPEMHGAVSDDGSIYVVGPRTGGQNLGVAVVKVPTNGSAPSALTHLAGGQIYVRDITVAPDGGIVLVASAGTGLPVVNGYEGPQGKSDAYVTSLSPVSGAQTYATYLGGSGNDTPGGVAVGSDGGTYVTGETSSGDFDSKRPVPSQGQTLEPDLFVTKIAPDGRSLGYSTSIGATGAESGSRIAVTGDGSAVVVGASPGGGFPIVGSDLALADDVNQFLVRVAPRGRSLSLSTRFGGTQQDQGRALTIDESGDIWTAGTSSSPDLPGLIGPGPIGSSPTTMVAGFDYEPEVVAPFVKAKRRQVPRSSGPISISLRVGAAEAVEARIAGTVVVGDDKRHFPAATKAVRFDESREVRLRLSRRKSHDLLRGLRAGDRGSAKVRVELVDEDGDSAKRSIKIALNG